ncbi:MAG: transporter substrate-binding protein [Ramlibacter sp.]|nr:transporter substrate-binding protein [Ramlibacter sp.]
MFTQFKRLAVITVTAIAASLPAQAEDITALDRIIKSGTVKVAIDLSAPPFGLQDKEMKPAGADVEVAQMLAKDLGVKLEIVQVNGANRIPYLMTKRVDFVISAFAVTPERAKSITFSIPYGGMRAVVVAPKDKKIGAFADLEGKKIGIARGTTNETDLATMAPAGAQIIRFDDEASAQAAMLSGQTDGYATGEIMTKAFSDRNPGLKLEPKLTLRNVYFAVGMRRGDPDMARWIDIWVMSNKSNGAFSKIYQKWLGNAMADLPVF